MMRFDYKFEFAIKSKYYETVLIKLNLKIKTLSCDYRYENGFILFIFYLTIKTGFGNPFGITNFAF